ncbi:hypothetical protein GBT05_20055 [Escherichia coli]|nr:hypothetical protein [Escherichia coli]EFC2072264.1 hypothetical protein [Escherichia coli]EFC4015379.1 hypothetical protein [Escherichia coli]EFC4532162.1 hypothetical protein [Escherichia coli]EFD5439545.1 hypothetical protein [Escherichia coli]
MSIKNDGHYFCRAGGNRPDGLNEPVTMVCHLCIESGFNAELFQQPIKLTEVFRGFEVFGQFVSQSL